MNGKNWILAIVLGLLLIGGFVLEASAQQPATSQAPTETAPAPAPAQPTPEKPTAPTPTPRTEYGGQPSQTPPTGSQIDTRPAAGGEGRSFLGVDPTIAMLIGAVLLVIIVISLVAMTRRTDSTTRNTDTEVRRTHTRTHV